MAQLALPSLARVNSVPRPTGRRTDVPLHLLGARIQNTVHH
ncbi:hypothetical protein [Cryobacterium sp. Y50]|nr:hypothetical protein [Cryobacterium sp. Y50]